MSDEKELSALEILETIENGTFLEYISNECRKKRGDPEQLKEAISSLHNSGVIDVFFEFRRLENKSELASDFFGVMHFLQKILPSLNGSVQKVIDCVQHFTAEAGQDLASGLLLQPLTDFCKVSLSRVDEALDFILSDPELYGNLLTPVLLAGTSQDLAMYVDRAIGCCHSNNVMVRRNAIFALGRINFSQGSEWPENILNLLAHICETELQDQVLSCVIGTACNISDKDNSYSTKAVGVLSSALSRGDRLTLFAASHVFGYQTESLSEEILDTILTALIEVNPEHAGILRNIAFGISILLKGKNQKKGIEFLERLLLRHQGTITIKSLSHLAYNIMAGDISLLNKLMTKWFLKGDQILCDSIWEIVDNSHNKEPCLSIDQAELPPGNAVHHVFVARKAIGYLFFKAVTCTSILLSLMENFPDKDVLENIGRLIFDPILLNFSGGPYQFLKENMGKYSDSVNTEIEKAMNSIDNYLDDLKSIPVIPEMFPSQEQREIQRRSIARKMSESLKEAQKDSIMELLCSKSVLLYGRSSIVQVFDNSGKSNRMEIPMQKHSVSIEFPRQADISPVDTDLMLRVFRNERMVER